MRAMFLALLLLAGCVSVTIRDDGDLLSEMRALEAARGIAIREADTATLERIYAEDFSGVNAAGVNVTRAELFSIFARARNVGALADVNSEVLSVREEGGLAIVTGRLRVGGDQSLYLHVFRRTGGHWEMITGAAVPARRP